MSDPAVTRDWNHFIRRRTVNIHHIGKSEGYRETLIQKPCNVGSSTSHKPIGRNGLSQGQLYFTYPRFMISNIHYGAHNRLPLHPTLAMRATCLVRLTLLHLMILIILCEECKFNTEFTRALHLPLSWARPIESTSQHPNSKRSILILSTHLRLRLSRGFPTNNLYALLFFPIRPTCPAHLIFLYSSLLKHPLNYWKPRRRRFLS
jgi:hypothetical protein